MKCICCTKTKNINQFPLREDRLSGHYKFCFSCIVEQGRYKDWPPMEQRGGGRLIFSELD